MMMTSTFPTSRASSQNIRNGIRELQSKKERLIALEAALKKRINEFRELCLKEGELTGQLPLDYPLQPREPIPQVRRRIARSYGNIPNETSTNLVQPCRTKMSQQQQHHNRISSFALPSPYVNVPFPSRPTSTNSSSSSASTASSSNTKNNNNHLAHITPPSYEFPKMVNIDEVTNFQPYYEETKPFQMSDFYKYSSKHRQKVSSSDSIPKHSLETSRANGVSYQHHFKTTRQLQDDVSRSKNSLKFASCDDQIQASVRLIEKSGQKLIEATAKAIVGNPSLAEKLKQYST